MKKFLTIATVAVFVFTLAAVTYAVDFNFSGFVRNRTALYMNADEDLPATLAGLFDGQDDTQSWVDYRARLKLDAVASEELKGTIYFEMDDTWGGGDEGGVGADGKDLEIKNAFVDFLVPGTEGFPTRAQVGIHGVFLNGNFGVDDDASGITVDTKIEPAEIRLLWFKGEENLNYQSDDIDHYGARVTVPFGDVRASGWFLWSNVGSGTTTGSLGPDNSSSDLYWIGGSLEGKIGPASFLGDFAYNGGDLEYSVPVGTVDQDEFGGYAFLVKASIPVGEFEVGAEFMYSTGDDVVDAATDGEFDGYRTPAGGAAYHPTVVFWSSSVNDSVGLTGSVDEGGAWLIKGYGSFKPLDWLKVTGYAAYIGDTVDEGDKLGTEFDVAATEFEDNGDIGIEIGAIADISIYKGLDYKIAAGWLFAGDALTQFDVATGTNEDPDDPWAIVSQLIYKF